MFAPFGLMVQILVHLDSPLPQPGVQLADVLRRICVELVAWHALVLMH
jgi:hypothetical protein